MNIDYIIDKYYKENAPLKRILLLHSKAVAEKAVQLAKMKQLTVDLQFVYDAAMLHDIGIVECNAPGIECFGKEHYICHGLCGGKILRENASEMGMTSKEIEPYARVCERHTGAGLTANEIKKQGLPLPEMDLLPETIEEKLICYADKFYSKIRLTEEKTIDHVLRSMQKFGDDTVNRFLELKNIFE